MYRTSEQIRNALTLYLVTDPDSAHSACDQVAAAISGGATFIQYRNKAFCIDKTPEVMEIRERCRKARIPFVVNDDILLAKAVSADGVHLGQDDTPPSLARKILGENAVIGISVSSLAELETTDLAECDYIGIGPVFATATKPDAKPACGTDGLALLCKKSPLPVVAIGGITRKNATACMEAGCDGIAVISAITRTEDMEAATSALSAIVRPQASGSPERMSEFELIESIIEPTPFPVGPGDDAALLASLERPVISTDTQREGVHFRQKWMTFEEIGYRAAMVSLSDLAASFADPVAVFVNAGLPNDLSDADARGIQDGIRMALLETGGHIAGGNISKSPILSLDLTVVGESFASMPLRKNARPGEIVCTTGPTGLAAAACHAFLHELPASKRLKAAFIRPRARFDAARILADHGISCAMDISDGLAGDLSHIATASSVHVRLSEFAIHPEVAAFAGAHALSPKRFALAGGEDYELLFTCKEDRLESLRKPLPDLVIIGKIEEGAPGISGLPEGISGFRHR